MFVSQYEMPIMEMRRQKPVHTKNSQKLQQSSLLPQRTSVLSTDVTMLLLFAVSIRLLQPSLLGVVSTIFDDALPPIHGFYPSITCYLFLYFCLIYT